MRKLPAFGFAGVAAAALAGTAYAAAPKTHVMNVPLPDGSMARVEYVGDVAPKVTIAPRAIADSAGAWAMPFPSFAGFDRMIAEMQRQSREMMRRAQDMSHHGAGASPYIASYGNLPAGQTSTTIVSGPPTTPTTKPKGGGGGGGGTGTGGTGGTAAPP